jgi:2-keto-4-pentenoate hydratase/2-oxohepta-3-ene-1,7-dioic acid hydratase in catechol pathway
MKFGLGTFSNNDAVTYPGIVIDERVIKLADLGRDDKSIAFATSVLDLLEDWGSTFNAINQLLETANIDNIDSVPLAELKVHPPINLPRQVFCSGANYRKHVIDFIVDTAPEETDGMDREQRLIYATEMMDKRAATGSPYIFQKSLSCVVGAYDGVILDRHSKKTDWELELAVVIGKTARNVSRDEAMDYVAGYTIANDITNRDLLWCKDDMKAMGTNWYLAKCSPTYLPLGPYIVPSQFIDDPQNLQMVLKLNGDVMQDGNTDDMIFDIKRLVEYLSSHSVLWPGDIICTGSPAGNATHHNRYLKEGDVMECSINGLGIMRNRCAGYE